MSKKLKNILICVAGATPQVITETIYALSCKTPPVYVDELHVITTAYGKKLIVEKLLNGKILSNLIKEYKLPPISFNEDNIVVINDGNLPLEDIRNDHDNEITGDVITEVVRNMAERENVALHCSIAGGRKTMSFYLGSALQLFGRPQDKLYHVLVSPEFENNPEFFYPPRKPKRLRCRLMNGEAKFLSTTLAEVHLADLPFVRLRDKVYLEKKGFKELIKEAEEGIRLLSDHKPLRFRLAKREVLVGSVKINLPPMLISIYALFAEEKIKYCREKKRDLCLECNECYLKVADLSDRKTLQRIKSFYTILYGEESMRLYDERWNLYYKKGGLPQDTIRQYISKINRAIREYVSDYELYEIRGVRQYGATRYGLKVDKTRIEMI